MKGRVGGGREMVTVDNGVELNLFLARKEIPQDSFLVYQNIDYYIFYIPARIRNFVTVATIDSQIFSTNPNLRKL